MRFAPPLIPRAVRLAHAIGSVVAMLGGSTVFAPSAGAVIAKTGSTCRVAGARSGTLLCTRKSGKLVWARASATAATVKSTATAPATAAATTTGIAGTWKATGASTVGYRVKEVLNGQSTEGVGRTSAVTGTLTIAGTTATAAALTIDVTTLKSDQGNRDRQVQGRILETATFPTASLKLLTPVALAKVPADKEQVTSMASVELTLRGKTKKVDVALTSRRNGATIEVQGAIPVVFADYAIPNPSIGPVKTADNGIIEFIVVFGR